MRYMHPPGSVCLYTYSYCKVDHIVFKVFLASHMVEGMYSLFFYSLCIHANGDVHLTVCITCSQSPSPNPFMPLDFRTAQVSYHHIPNIHNATLKTLWYNPLDKIRVCFSRLSHSPSHYSYYNVFRINVHGYDNPL